MGEDENVKGTGTLSAVVFVSRPLTGRLFDAKGANWVMYPAIAMYAIAFLALANTAHWTVLLLSSVLFALGFGNFTSGAQAVCLRAVRPERYGVATSTYFILADLGFGFGPFALGLLPPLVGLRGLFQAMAGVVLFCLPLYYLTFDWRARAGREKRLNECESNAG
jgi:MFS family permease